MGAVVWKFSGIIEWNDSGFAWEKIGMLAGSILLACAVYFSLAKLFRVEESDYLFGMIKKRLTRG